MNIVLKREIISFQAAVKFLPQVAVVPLLGRMLNEIGTSHDSESINIIFVCTSLIVWLFKTLSSLIYIVESLIICCIAHPRSKC